MTRMKSHFMFLAVITAMGLASVSFAQGRDNERHEDHGHRDQERRGGPEQRAESARHGPSHRHAMPSREDQFAYGARGPEWHRGGRIPPMYRGHQYVVNDWQAHHLRRPPRGYQWVQVGGDYVLVAIATGIIADLLINQ